MLYWNRVTGRKDILMASRGEIDTKKGLSVDTGGQTEVMETT